MNNEEPVQRAQQGYDPHEIEARILEHWREEDARARVRKARQEGPRFYFVDGPPYTSGHIHMGTAWNKVMKDLMVRFYSMRGYNVRDQPGYDMHGLPIEVKVEKELGIQDKNEIEAYGVDNFVNKCREFSTDFLASMTEEFKQLGVWLDWEKPYRTVDASYIEGAWWALAQAHENGLLYQDNRGGLSWCPRCETALAQAEIEYEDRIDPSIFVRLPLVDEDASLVVWTTTPWTLPANNAVAVHPELTYARVLVTDEQGDALELIIEETCIETVTNAAGFHDAHVTEHIEGHELQGLAYEHPFEDEVPYHQEKRSDAEYTVILADHVTADKTGLVHTATGHGKEDYEIGQEVGIAPFSPVGSDGTYSKEAGDLEGLRVRKGHDEQGNPPEGHADAVVIERLDEAGFLLASGLDEHSYGHCWRCKTPILYRTTEQWFLAVTEVKDTMLEEVDRVDWTPEWAGAARQRDWVENAHDWCISRQRYWGIPLPVWTCQRCDAREVVSDKETLQGKSGDTVEDLHRPWVDEVTFPCTECEGTMQRVEDVLDVWFDSAVASWASLGYPRDEDAFEAWFPCDFIIEGLDQTRGWFYSQLAAGVTSMGRVPYEEVVMHGFVHDETGTPMSKSIGNIVAPGDVIDAYGVDATRWSLLESSAPWDDLRYGEDTPREAQRTLNILWNVHVFATQYMSMDAYAACAPDWDEDPPQRALDRWILSRLATTTGDVTRNMENHAYHRAARALETFILEDVSRWYVSLNRDRAWRSEEEEKTSLYDALTVVLGTTARLLAPFVPHMAEAIWSDLYPSEATVHAQDWPTPDPRLRDGTLEEHMALARDIVEATSRAREKEKLSTRWPVPRIVLAGDEKIGDTVDRLGDVLAERTNAKEVTYAGDSWEELELVAEPVPDEIGPAFRGDAPDVMEAIHRANAEKLKPKIEAGETVDLEGFEVTPGMVTFTTEVPEGILGTEFEEGSVFVDAHLTPEMEAEGFSRELLRRIQEMRKQADLAMEAQVGCLVELPEDAGALSEAIEQVPDAWGAWLEEEGRVDLSFQEAGDDARAWEIEDVLVRIRLDA